MQISYSELYWISESLKSLLFANDHFYLGSFLTNSLEFRDDAGNVVASLEKKTSCSISIVWVGRLLFRFRLNRLICI